MTEFFEKPSAASEVKISIVSQYFHMWSQLMKMPNNNPSNKFSYIDLFAGPGYYEDGTSSIPINILNDAINDKEKQKKFLPLFNDSDPQIAEKLKENIENIEGYDKLTFKPKIENKEVDERFKDHFKEANLIPTLLFIDPWGYKGLSLELVGSILKDKGCDCFFFFNYNRINAAVENSSFEDGSIQEVFGKKNTEELKSKLFEKKPFERELITLEFLREKLRTKKGQYTFAIRFKNEQNQKTSHFLILTSKHPLAHSFIKDISFKKATSYLPKMDAFEFDPKQSKQLQLFDIANPKYLAEGLKKRFRGKELKVKEIYWDDHMGTPYLKTHYKKALLYLESIGTIEVIKDGKKRRKGTLGEEKFVKFKD
jgi:three-Cys-motif partner protein